MASLLDSIAADQERTDNADLAQAQHDLNWTSTFRSTPPAEVSRARANYTDAIDRALTNKIALQARTDIGALRLQQKAAEHEEWVKQAPMREALLKAHVDATGATERRKAEESALTMKQTAALNRGMADFYKNGGLPGTPEAQQAALGLLADNPMAHVDHVLEIGKQAGITDVPPEQVAAKAAALRDELAKQGFENTAIGSTKNGVTFRQTKAPEAVTETGFRGTPDEARAKYGPSAVLKETSKGVWSATLPATDEASRAADKTRAVMEVKQEFKPKQQEIIDTFVAKRAALEQFKPTDQQKIQYRVDLKNALKDVDPTDAEKIKFAVAKATALDAAKTTQAIERVKAVAAAHGTPASVTNLYSQKLGELSGLDQLIRDEGEGTKKAEYVAKKIKNEELIRSLESIHPELRKTRGLDGGMPDAAPAAVLAPESEGRIGPPSPDAPAPNPNQAALDWLQANPNDPRAAAVKAKLGL